MPLLLAFRLRLRYYCAADTPPLLRHAIAIVGMFSLITPLSPPPLILPAASPLILLIFDAAKHQRCHFHAMMLRHVAFFHTRAAC